MNKISLRSHLLNKWPLYILGIGIAFLISSIAITISSTPNRKEKISIFLTAYEVKEGFYEYLDSIKPDYIELMEVQTKPVDDNYYYVFFDSLKDYSDIIIIPESKLSLVSHADYVKLDDSVLDKFTSKDFEYFTTFEKNIAIKIYSKDTNEGMLDNFITYKTDESVNENYYLFINIDSYHLGDINNSMYDGLIDVLRGLLDYEN